MQSDFSNWKPLTVTEVSTLFSRIPISWGIAGGWALDMHLGRKTREHSDIEVVIFREDQQVVHQHLKNDWMLYKAKDGKLSPWQEKEHLDVINDVWVSRGIHTYGPSRLCCWIASKSTGFIGEKRRLKYQKKNYSLMIKIKSHI